MTTTTPQGLPELSDDRVAAMESELFARIADEPSPLPAPTAAPARRGRAWLGALGGAAAVVLAVLVVPAAVTGVTSGSGGSGGAWLAEPAVITDGAESGVVTSEVADGAVDQAGGAAAALDGSREVIASGSATVRVDDVAAAIRAIGEDAEARGGYVESTSTDGGQPVPLDTGAMGDSVYNGYVVTARPSGYITVRVPADQLAAATSALSEVGEVTASAVNRQDVTDQAIDLRARVESLQASVDRLNALVAQAQTVQDVIAVESELSARQADLESYRQQLQYLEGQVSLSSLTVTVVTPDAAVTADPAGFGDGLAAGWNGLVATLNGLVIAIGFLLPWIGVAAVIALVVWLVVRARRRRRAAAQRVADERERSVTE